MQVAQDDGSVLKDKLLVQRVRREVGGAVAGRGAAGVFIQRSEALVEACRVEQRGDVEAQHKLGHFFQLLHAARKSMHTYFSARHVKTGNHGESCA